MWINCADVLVNLGKLNYIKFDKTDEGAIAFLYFENGEILEFQSEDEESLKNYFIQLIGQNE